MRFLMVAIWSLLIGLVITYVVTSMAGAPFNLSNVFIIAAVFFVAIAALGEVILKEKEEH
ncbi:MAG TPA: DUF2929 family protein [Bacillota bacterium]|nr:DUF2929 family protein [Bacillota bacterium]